MADGAFRFEIKGLDKLSAAFIKSPEIVEPIMQYAINKSQATIDMNRILPTNTPMRTGNLANRWTTVFSSLMMKTKPDMNYARAVQYGMPASPGRFVPAIGKRLKNGQNIGMWPGFAGRFFMQKILNAAAPDINTIFKNALDVVVEKFKKL